MSVDVDQASGGPNRSGGHRFFAAPADDPRARRPVDVVLLISSVLAVAVLAWSHRSRRGLDTRVRDFFVDGVPDWISGTGTIVFILGGLYALGLVVGIAVFGSGRGALVRDMVMALALTYGAALVTAYLAGPEFPDFVPELIERGGYPSFPVTRLAATVAVISVTGPFLSAPMRKIGGRLLMAMSVSSVVMVYGTVTGVLGGLALGVAAAAAVHLVFGSGRGIPSRDRITTALGEAGIVAVDITYAAKQPPGATLVTGTRPDGERMRIKVYGRDAADAAFASRAWRSIWYRDQEGMLAVSRLQLAEHEALAMLALERAGVPAARLQAASRASTDDILLISDWVDGATLSDLDADVLTDEVLDGAWSTLASFHAAGIAHGGIDRERVVVGDSGVVFTDVGAAALIADEDAKRSDRAQLLVATALSAGDDRSIDAARRHLADDELLATAPLLQTAALPAGLQRDVDEHDYRVKELRRRIADELGAEMPELEPLRRISWGGLAMVVLTLFAAYSLISSLTEIGLETIVDQFAEARWSWIVLAVTMAQLTNIGEYFSLAGVMGQRIPFGPTIMFRYAISFISLAVPSDAGAIAMNIRYQQRLGVPPAAAVAQGPLLTIVSKAFDVVLLLITAQFVSSNLDLDEVDLGPVVKLVIAIVIAALVAISVVAAVPRWRALVAPHLKEGFGAVKGSFTDPDRLTKVVGGTLLQKVLFAMTLAASVAAYGSHLPFASAVFVNTAVSLFVGLMPVPGGIGVGEAALTAGLIAVGIPEEVAIAAAITHRMVTSYLPPVFGWWASRWLTERDYL